MAGMDKQGTELRGGEVEYEEEVGRTQISREFYFLLAVGLNSTIS
jgi:hypothetical protein